MPSLLRCTRRRAGSLTEGWKVRETRMAAKRSRCSMAPLDGPLCARFPNANTNYYYNY